MTPVRPALVPDPSADTTAMYETQRRVAELATFADDDGTPEPAALDDRNGPLVAGVDQAVLSDPDRAVAAVVVLRGDEVVERTHAVSPLELPYVPGLLSFREGGPALDALATLGHDPDLLVVDGSGRIHPRQAGLATHLGVALGCHAVGVAKSLLCGALDDPADGRPTGWRTPIRAADGVDASPETVIGHAFQSRQFDSGVVNPLYVSPGHRVSAATATALVAACGGAYKPEDTDVEQVVARMVDEEGRIDCLVNNAGYGQFGPIEDVPVERAQRQYDVNVHGPHRLARAVLPHMRDRADGTIVNVSSVAGRVSFPGGGVYAGSKFALEAMSDALRAEVGPNGVDVVVVEPGPVATKFTDRAEAEVDGVERSGAYDSFYAAFSDASLLGDDGPVTIPPERVAADIVNAASATKPRARYPVGTPARVGVLARFVPDRLRDRALALFDRLS